MFKTPEEGLYFNMPFEEYLAIPALSNSGIKDFLSSPNRFWEYSWMNPERPEREEKAHQIYGTAYHCRILEGKKKYDSIYAPEFDADDYPDALKTLEDLKEATRAYKEHGHEVRLTGTKEMLSEQLLEIEPEIEIVDVIKKKYEADNNGKILLPQDIMDMIEKSALMVSLHPDASRTFSGGYPEVTVVWKDEVYGILHKARFDYLKVACHGELKTFENQYGRNLDRVPAQETAKYRYHLQYTLYCEAAEWARKFAGAGSVHLNGVRNSGTGDWLRKFAAFKDQHKAVTVFIDKELGEIRGKIFRPDMLTADCAVAAIQNVRERFVDCMKRYGESTRWIEPVPFDEFTDEEFPQFMFMD